VGAYSDGILLAMGILVGLSPKTPGKNPHSPSKNHIFLQCKTI
jgi:hypothetical protein